MKVATVRDPGVSRGTDRGRVVVAGVGSLVVVSALVGMWLDARIDVALPAAPFFGRWRISFFPDALPAIAVAVSVLWANRWRSAVPFRRLVLISAAASMAWGGALALTDGYGGLLHGIVDPHGYLPVLDRVASPSTFVHSFTDTISAWPVHVRSHPPGMVATLLVLDRIGLADPWVLAGFVVALTGSCVAAALIVTRDLGGEEAARRVAPFLVLAPAAIWMVSSYDAVFAAIGAWSVVMLVRAGLCGGRTSDALALAGGATFGLGLFFSYGLAPLALVPVVWLVTERRGRAIVLAASAAFSVALAWWWAGFSWIEGLAVTREQYAASIARERPMSYFVFANLAAFALVVGPAVWRGLGALHGRLWLVVGAGLAVILVADLSGLSKGEVERIWLPFWPWVAIAAAAVPDRSRTRWLAAQATTAIVLASILWTPW